MKDAGAVYFEAAELTDAERGQLAALQARVLARKRVKTARPGPGSAAAPPVSPALSPEGEWRRGQVQASLAAAFGATAAAAAASALVGLGMDAWSGQFAVMSQDSAW